MSENPLRDAIQEAISENQIILFMKGTPEGRRAASALAPPPRCRPSTRRSRPSTSCPTRHPPGAVGDLGLAHHPAAVRRGRARRRLGHHHGALRVRRAGRDARARGPRGRPRRADRRRDASAPRSRSRTAWADMSGRAGAVALALTAALLAAAPAGAARRCAPRPVPSWQSITGAVPGGAPATGEQVGAYLQAVDAASPRVATGVLGRSPQGRPLPYAVIAEPGTLARLDAVAARLRAPRRHRARHAPRPAPPIVWLTAGCTPTSRAASTPTWPSSPTSPRAGSAAAAPARRGRRPAAEPRRPRRGHPHERRRLRPQPRLVRRDAARDARDARPAAPPTAAGARRPARAGGPAVLLPAERRPGPPRGPRPGRAAHDRRHRIAPALRRAFDRAGRQHASFGSYDLFYMGYADTRRDDPVRRGRHDVRAGRRGPVRRARGRAHAGRRDAAARERPPCRDARPALERRLAAGPGRGRPRGAAAQRAPRERRRARRAGAAPARLRLPACAPTSTAPTPPRSPPG